MQTVNFHCPHCGNLMAVGTNLLGRNVRCPHCKQVVRAPAAAGEPPGITIPAPQAPPLTPAPPPQFKLPAQTEHHESIFGERHDEDVFGSEPLKPTMPSVLAPAPPTLEETVAAPPPPSPHQPPNRELAETEAYEGQSPLEFPFIPTNDEPAPSPADRGAASPDQGYRPRPARPEAPATPAFVWTLLVYSVVITVVAGILAYQYFTAQPKGDHPFKAIPDFFGKYEKATGAENRKQLSFQGLPDPKLDVPPDLRVKLGDEITVGAIQVQPTAVFQQVMEVTRENAVRGDIVSDAGKGLILMLHVKNVSTETTLYPDDPAFHRAFSKDQPVPYTALQNGRDFFYGPFAWPLEPDIKDVYFTKFKPTDEPLGPGQERDIAVFVAPDGLHTSGERSAVRAVQNALDQSSMNRVDQFLWRVQLRRGFVKAQADDGREVDISATTVIGVEFKADDVKER